MSLNSKKGEIATISLPITKSKRKYNRPVCNHSGCKHRRAYGFNGDILWCIKHRQPGMRRREGACSYGSCYRNANCGYIGKKNDPENRCYVHRLPGMVLFCKIKHCTHEAVKGLYPSESYCEYHASLKHCTLNRRPHLIPNPLDQIEALDICIEDVIEKYTTINSKDELPDSDSSDEEITVASKYVVEIDDGSTTEEDYSDEEITLVRK